MNRRSKVELFEEIRLGYAAGETIKGLAKQHGVHRRMVRQAVASSITPERKKHEREQPKLDPVKEAIDRMLDRTGRRRGSSGIQHTWSGRDCVKRSPTIRSASRPCGATCGNGNKKWDWAGGKCSCRRATTGAKKAKWIGLRRWPNWMGNCASCSCSRCAVWRRATRSIGPIPTPYCASRS